MSDPVCLIQWLGPNEFKEVQTAWKAYAQSINITLTDATSKDEVAQAIKNWLHDNPNTQCLYIGAHGDANGFGTNVPKAHMTWNELRDILITAQNPPVVWLGMCSSSSVARAWSPIVDSCPAAWLTTFEGPVMPKDCLRMLERSLCDSGIDELTFVDQELGRLRADLPHAAIKQFYPACPKGGEPGYVDVDDFEAVVGVSFKTFLQRPR